jgi:molybdopterin molybdotransferase
VVEVIRAGAVADRALEPGRAMRIMTGAAVPDGADAVVPFENAQRRAGPEGERVRIVTPASAGANIRDAGRDVAAGDVALESGRRLSAHDLALAASLGVGRLAVGRRPRVAVLSTGDELLEVDEPLRPGAIRDSNRLMLSMLVEEAGGAVVRAERLGDDERRATTAIRSAIEEADAVLTIGGISAGDFDPVKVAFREIGGVALWRVAMKPGQPQAFGTPGKVFVYGLPGNPASVACVFEVMVGPALLRMQGAERIDRPLVEVRAAEPIASREGRRDFVRVTLERRGDAWWARPAGEQVSGHLSPQSRAHALAVVPEERASVETGDRLDALVLRWPGSP